MLQGDLDHNDHGNQQFNFRPAVHALAVSPGQRLWEMGTGTGRGGGSPYPEIVLGEGCSIQGQQSVPAALYREGEALRQPLQGVGVRAVRLLLLEQLPVHITAHPAVVEPHRQLSPKHLQNAGATY